MPEPNKAEDVTDTAVLIQCGTRAVWPVFILVSLYRFLYHFTGHVRVSWWAVTLISVASHCSEKRVVFHVGEKPDVTSTPNLTRSVRYYVRG